RRALRTPAQNLDLVGWPAAKKLRPFPNSLRWCSLRPNTSPSKRVRGLQGLPPHHSPTEVALPESPRLESFGQSNSQLPLATTKRCASPSENYLPKYAGRWLRRSTEHRCAP